MRLEHRPINLLPRLDKDARLNKELELFSDPLRSEKALEIKRLAGLGEHLARLRVEEVMARALAEQAERMAAAVQDTLSEQSDAGEHDRLRCNRRRKT